MHVSDLIPRGFSIRALSVICFCIMGTATGLAISVRHDQPVSLYDSLADEFLAAGFVGDRFGAFCSGTLVAEDKVLTAAHCVDFNANGVPDAPASNHAFGLQENAPSNPTRNVIDIDINPLWQSSNGNASFDLAILTLGTPIVDVTPAIITDVSPAGAIGTMVGYGRQGDGNRVPRFLSGADDKLAAQNVIDVSGNTIRSDFDSPTSDTSTLGSALPIELEGTTAAGDSGGPLFAQIDGQQLLVGVLNGGFNPFGIDSEYGDVSVWAPIALASNLAFLAGHGILPFVAQESGDFNQDGFVDGRDFLIWQMGFGTSSGAKLADGDSDGDGDVDGDDFITWQSQFAPAIGGAGGSPSPAGRRAAVPEPAGLGTLCVCLLGLVAHSRPRRVS